MERILKNERRVEGDCKRYLLRYTLVSNGFPKEEGEGIYYGIITEQFVWTDEEERWEAQDTAQVKGFSESLEEPLSPRSCGCWPRTAPQTDRHLPGLQTHRPSAV